MNQQQVTIEEVSTLYNIDNTYHSDLMAANYTVKAFGTVEADNRITLTPGVGMSSRKGVANGQGKVKEYYWKDQDEKFASQEN